MVYHWPDFMPGKNKKLYSIIRSWMWCTIGQILRPVFHDKYQLEDQERKKNKNKRLYSILYFSIVWLHGIKIGKLSCSPLLEGYGPLSLQLEAAQFGGALGLSCPWRILQVMHNYTGSLHGRLWGLDCSGRLRLSTPHFAYAVQLWVFLKFHLVVKT